MCLTAGSAGSRVWGFPKATQQFPALPLERITKAQPCASTQATGFKSLLRIPLNGASQARTPEARHAFKGEK